MKNFLKIIIVFIISLTINIKDIQAEEIPKVFLTGDLNEMTSKKDERKVNLRYVSPNLEFEAYTKIKIQGNSSTAYDKKNYTIKLFEDNNCTDKKNIELGKNWGEQNKYYLKANWTDKTHSRNIVTANIISTIQKKYNLFMDSPNNGQIDGFPVEVYINNEFLGLYTWNIPKDNWTFNMDNDNPNHIVMAANDYNKSTYFREEADTENWEIEVGPETEETLEKFNRLINFVKDSNNQEFKKNFEKYLNLDATLNYFITIKYANLLDNVAKNVLMVTYDGEIWYPTLYDLDTSWGANWRGTTILDYTDCLNTHYKEHLLWKKFEDNFQKEISDRYFELRKKILTKENILNKFNKFHKTIPNDSLTKEQNKWEDIPGFDITQIEDFLNTRFSVLDQQMYKTYNIPPQINIEYSTQKATLKPVTVTLNPNRNDIIIVKNGKKSYDYTYTFEKNGEYTFEYQDWYGKNLGTITITINCIKTQTVINICTALLIITIGLTLYITSKKKKEKIIKENTPKEKNTANQTNTNSKTKKKSTNSTQKTKKQTKKNKTSNKKKNTE